MEVIQYNTRSNTKKKGCVHITLTPDKVPLGVVLLSVACLTRALVGGACVDHGTLATARHVTRVTGAPVLSCKQQLFYLVKEHHFLTIFVTLDIICYMQRTSF